ncbi:sulfurtransferase [Neptuniibacter sp.]|uniref:sulfurtransferase n=1 Tax=Neptuniibacter sp. TaxID=1962643 RepID=UPI00261B19B9|nr:sulfurtransferase [Neptuniibacter sp.]MCP4595696.1 sulfurtransferase [Neptuniibacter sp.]
MYQTIVSVETLKQNLGQPNWVVFDCRFNLMDTEAGQQAYAEAHIPGAFYLHLDNDLSSPISPDTGRHPLPDPTKLAEKLAQSGVDKNTQVVVYDDCGGAMAARTWWLLRWLGHDAVAVLDGGLPAWVAAESCSTEIPEARESGFTPELHGVMNLSVDQLQQELSVGDILLVDARAAERYRGEVEPIDPVAGHVPGAENRPLTDNLADGLFKSAEQLHEEWSAVLQGAAPDQVVHMCGSGVTACHNQLSMEIAGLTGSRIYSGSWSEWIRDPNRPVVLDKK